MFYQSEKLNEYIEILISWFVDIFVTTHSCHSARCVLRSAQQALGASPFLPCETAIGTQAQMGISLYNSIHNLIVRYIDSNTVATTARRINPTRPVTMLKLKCSNYILFCDGQIIYFLNNMQTYTFQCKYGIFKETQSPRFITLTANAWTKMNPNYPTVSYIVGDTRLNALIHHLCAV